MNSVVKNQDLVVAIDVGSTYSGYAWQWRSHFLNNRSNLEYNNNWGQGAPQMHKTTTALLLKMVKEQPSELPEGSVAEGPSEVPTIDNFGFAAERRYGNICSDPEKASEKSQYYLFTKFKLLLYREDQKLLTEIEDQEGRLFSFLTVMSLFIKALRQHFFKHHGNRGKDKIDESKILWVITVPALWSENAKKFMRDAAQESGIHKKRILLASEPEAATIFCMHLPSEQRELMNDLANPGHVFMTVDLGGGTADLSVVEVLEDGTLAEVDQERGERVGGQNVNEAFFQTCYDSFEGAAWRKKMQSATPLEIMKMEQDFEAKKMQIGCDEPVDERIELEIPKDLKRSIREKEMWPRKVDIQHLSVGEEELLFRSQYIRNNLFKESCNLIVATIEKVLKKNTQKNIQTVVLVGGFAESKIVRDEVERQVQERYKAVKVVSPTSPSKAVLGGAVFYGHDMFIYKSRISRATFGVGTNQDFMEGKHDPAKKWFDKETEKHMCKDILDVHVWKGASVVLKGQQPSREYVPLYKDQKSLTLGVYECSLESPNTEGVIYVTDPSCTKRGQIVVDMPDTSKGLDRPVKVTMVYGGTQLSVIMTDKNTGQEYNVDIDFEN